MKKFILCKLCLIVFGALLAVQSVSAGNWNQPENTAKSLGRFIKYETTDSGVTKYFGYSQLPPYSEAKIGSTLMMVAGTDKNYVG